MQLAPYLVMREICKEATPEQNFTRGSGPLVLTYLTLRAEHWQMVLLCNLTTLCECAQPYGNATWRP